MPAAAILAIKQRQPLLAGMCNDDPKTLAGTGRSRRFRLRHLLGRGAADGRLGQIAGSGGKALATREDIIVDRSPCLTSPCNSSRP